MAGTDITKYEWTRVDDLPVHIMKCGNWDPSCSEKALFLIIPGNPGSMGFYQTFAEILFSQSGIPVWGISHTGHVSVSKNLSSLGDENPVEHPKAQDCGLSPQIQHKISFLKHQVLPKVNKVYLIGHSIGCYIILHILDRMDEPKLHKGILLFPTIERMAVSPKGKWMTPMLVYFRCAIPWLAWGLNWLPNPIKRAIVDCLFKAVNEPSRAAVLNDIICPKVASCASYMGMQEMLVVDQRDDRIIREQSNKLHFYYGTIDHWCPVTYYEDMKRDFTDIDIRLCENSFKHAFVLRESEQVATIVAEWISSF